MNRIRSSKNGGSFISVRLIFIISRILMLTLAILLVMAIPARAEIGPLFTDDIGITPHGVSVQNRLALQQANPHFYVDASSESVWGNEWEPDSTVTVEVHGVSVDVPTDEVGDFGMDSGEDIVSGDTVTVIQGVISKSHVVTELAITVVDAETDTISGTAAPGSELYIWVHDVIDTWRHEIAAVDGSWTADFGNPGDETGEENTTDLVPGSNGNSGQCDVDDDCTNAGWGVPNPRFNVAAPHHDVWGHDWEPDSTVTIEVNDVAADEPTDEWGYFRKGDFFGILPGDTVTVTQGSVSKSHVVTELTFTIMNPDTDTVSGTAAVGSEVNIEVHDMGNVWRRETAAPDGSWSADFSTPGDEPGEDNTADLNWGTNGDASQCDTDDDCSIAYLSGPRFNLEAAGDGIWGDYWAPNSTVTVEVHGVATDAPTNEQGNFDINSGEDILPGDTVTVSQGVITKSHVVTELAITVADPDTDTVSGTATPGSEMDIWVHDVGDVRRHETVAPDGTWSADFSTPGDEPGEESTADLLPGMNGNSAQCDAEGDCTFAWWHVANPNITASVSHEEIWASDWPDDPEGQTLYYRVYESYDPASPETAVIAYEHFMTLIVTPWGTEAGDRLFSDLDLMAGQTLIVRNREFTGSPEPGPLVDGIQKELAISEIEVTSVDPDTDIIAGIAYVDQGPVVCADAHEARLCSGDVGFTWNPDGTWTADFTGISEIRPGQWNSASQYDGDGDETHFWWNLPPWIVAELAQEDLAGDPLYPDVIRAETWTGPTVTLIIDDPATPGEPDYESGPMPVDENGNYNFELGINTPEWSGFDLEEDHIVTITDGTDTKVLVVERLTINRIYLYNEVPPNVVEGTAYPFKNVRVEPWTSYGWWAERWVNANAAGDWLADFDQPGSGWREQWTAEFGATAGEGGGAFAEIYDEDNDRTWSIYHEPDPRIIVVRGNDRVEVIDFPEGNEVTLEIDDPAIPGSPDYTDSGIVTRNPDRPWETLLNFELGEYIVPDESQVTASDGVTTVIHDVLIDFTVDAIDPDSDTVSGTAPVGAEIQVEVYDNYWRYPIADGSGIWVADFSVPGTEPGEDQPYDITPGTSGRAVHLDVDGNATQIEWNVPQPPTLDAFPYEDYIDGWNWPNGVEVTLTIDDPSNGPGTDYSDTKVVGEDWDPNYVGFYFQGAFDLQAGNIVTLNDGNSTKVHIVTDLWIASIDPDADTVSGTASPGSELDIWVHDTDAWRRETVPPDGMWTADFSTPGDEPGEEGITDLVPGSNGNSSQCDAENDCTVVGWRIPNPQFSVEATSDGVWGHEWEPDSMVTVEVQGVPTDVPTDEGGNFGMNTDEDIVPGDTVTVTQGTVSKSHVVTELAITIVDPDADTIYGTAAPDSEVDIWVDNIDYNVWRREAVAPDGTWSADFSTPGDGPGEDGTIDLTPGMEGNSAQCDADDDCTFAGWGIPDTRFLVEPLPDYVEGYEWVPDSMVTVEVHGVATDVSTDEWGNFGTGLNEDIVPGDTVTVTQGAVSKSHVVTQLAITEVDPDADTVSGMAAPSSELYIWVHDTDVWRHETVAGDGTWSADFSIPGDEQNEEGTTDLVPGSNGNSAQCDGDGDCTNANWRIPNPQFQVHASTDNVSGNEWEPDSMVTVEVHGVTTDLPTDEGGNFGMDIDEDIVPGDTVTVTQGAVAKSHVVTELAITGVDADADTVYGIAAPDSELYIWEHDTGVWRHETAAGDGSWSADFGTPGDEPGEEDTADLVPGSNGNSDQCDSDNDCTNANWRIPNTRFNVHAPGDYVWGHEWEPFSTVTVEVHGVPFDIPTDEVGDFGSDIGEDIVPGDIVTVTQGAVSKSHEVTALAITAVDPDTDTVYGTAAPGSELDNWVNDTDAWRRETAAGDGSWASDFSIPGDESGEEGTADLVPGSNGDANQCDAENDCTFDWWNIPNPRFHVYASTDHVSGNEWEPDSTVTVEVHGVTTDLPTDGGGNFGSDIGEDIVPGDIVTVTQGAVSKSHVVTELAISEVDPDADTVSGFAAPSSELATWVNDVGDFVWRRETAAGDGSWTADFSTPGDEPGEEGTTDLIPGSRGDSVQCDSDDDCTNADWRIPNPRFWVNPSTDNLGGDEWTPNGQVSVTVNTTEVPGSPFALDENGNFGTGLSVDLQASDEVVVTDVTDPTISKDHTITSLTIDGVDDATNTVWGTAAVGSDVWVDIHGEGNVGRTVTATDGTWLVDFDDPGDGGGTFDLEPGTDGYANQCDIDDDCTWIDWRIPNPSFIVYANWDDVEGNNWEPDSFVTVEVHGVPTDVPTDEWGNFYQGLDEDIVPGDIVTVTQGAVSKSHLVTELAITEIDPDTDTVSGSAEPGSEVDVWVNNIGHNVWRRETAAGDGTWTADFSTPGDGPGEEGTTDLVPGLQGEAAQCDDDNDCTFDWWGIPDPRFWVYPSRDHMSGEDWEPDSTVTVEVHGVPTDIPTNEWGDFGMDILEDIVPGDTVTVTQGATTKSHVVTELAITGADSDTDMVYGTATPGSELYIWVHDVGDVWRHETVAPDGTWSADFGTPGDEPGEEGTTDLVPGSNGNSDQCDDDNDCTNAEWQIPNPQFNVHAPGDYVWGHEWEPNSSVTVEVHGVPFDVPTDEGGNFGTDISEDIVPGDTVTVTQGTTTKSHVVTELAITAVDPDADTVFGTAAPGSELNNWVNDTDAWRRETTAGDGSWASDFSIPGDESGEEGTANLVPGMNGDANQCDAENDCTNAFWRIPNPRFWVDPSSDSVWGDDWTPNGQVTITVNTTEVPGSPFALDENGNFGTDLNVDLQANDEVVFTDVDDPTISKDHTITSLTIDGVDDATNTVWGTAAVGSDVWVDSQAGGGNVGRTVTAIDGTWLVDFDDPGDGGGTFDLEPGTNGYASQCDIDNDCTEIIWRIPNPQFNVDASYDSVWGHEWEPDSWVTVEVHGISTDIPTNEWGDFDMGTDEDIIPGDTVTVTQGVVSKSHVVTELAITDVDPDTDTISGTAEPGSEVDIWVHNSDAWRRETVAPDGTWSVDFSIPGDEDNEQSTADLVPGLDGNSAQCDAENDCTFAGWYIPNPHFQVRLMAGEAHGYEWPLGASVTLTIDDPGTPENPDFEDTQTVEVAPWDPDQTFVWFSYQDVLAVVDGFLVTMTDGATLKEHIVTTLALGEVDVDNDLVSGTAEPDSEVWVDACNGYCATRLEVTDEFGNWTADFSVPGSMDFEQDTFDIGPGTGGEARQHDEDGDATQVEWYLTDPPTCDPGDSVMGTVYESDGLTPIFEATIFFDNFHTGEQLFQVQSGEDGTYGCALPDGDYRLWAVAGGYSRQYYAQAIYEDAVLVPVAGGISFTDIDFILDTPNTVFDHLTFNMSDPIVSELAVRQAVAYGTDRASIIAATYPDSPIWDTYLPPNHWAHAASGVPQYGFDPQLARDTLTAAGWVDGDGDGVREKDGQRLHIEYVTSDASLRATISQIFVENMADIGIEIEVFALPSPWDRIFTNHDFGITQFAWGIDYNDEHTGSSVWFVFETDHTWNSGLYSNPTSDQLLANTAAAPTRAEKLVYLEPHQALVMTDLAMLPIVERIGDTAGTYLWIDPPETTLPVSSNFTVDLIVSDVTDLYGVELEITFDPALVEVVDADPGTAGIQIEPGSCPAADFVVLNDVDNATGAISYAATSLFPSPPCSGNGVIASITFHGLAEGISPVHFNSWLLSDADLNTIPVSRTEDGALNVISTGILEGTVDLQGRSDESGAEVCIWQGGVEVECMVTDESGHYSFSLPEDSYDVFIEMARYLDAERMDEVVVAGGTTTLCQVKLLAGDAGDDDVINILDLSFMGFRFGQSIGDPNYDERADVNNDGTINILDLVGAGANFNETSPVPWPCP